MLFVFKKKINFIINIERNIIIIKNAINILNNNK